MAAVCGALAALAVVAIGLTPADTRSREHLLAITGAGGFGLAWLSVLLVALVRSERPGRGYLALTTGCLLLAVLQYWRFFAHFYLGREWTWRDPVLQKVLTLYGLGWIAATAWRCWQTTR